MTTYAVTTSDGQPVSNVQYTSIEAARSAARLYESFSEDATFSVREHNTQLSDFNTTMTDDNTQTDDDVQFIITFDGEPSEEFSGTYDHRFKAREVVRDHTTRNERHRFGVEPVESWDDDFGTTFVIPAADDSGNSDEDAVEDSAEDNGDFNTTMTDDTTQTDDDAQFIIEYNGDRSVSFPGVYDSKQEARYELLEAGVPTYSDYEVVGVESSDDDTTADDSGNSDEDAVEDSAADNSDDDTTTMNPQNFISTTENGAATNGDNDDTTTMNFYDTLTARQQNGATTNGNSQFDSTYSWADHPGDHAKKSTVEAAQNLADSVDSDLNSDAASIAQQAAAAVPDTNSIVDNHQCPHPLCGITHGHYVGKHDVRDDPDEANIAGFGIADSFADLMEFEANCHCGASEVAMLVRFFPYVGDEIDVFSTDEFQPVFEADGDLVNEAYIAYDEGQSVEEAIGTDLLVLVADTGNDLTIDALEAWFERRSHIEKHGSKAPVTSETADRINELESEVEESLFA